MPVVPIVLETKPGNRIGPKGNFRTQVKKDDIVTFEVPLGASGGGIVFRDRSPFGQKNVGYGGSGERVTADADPAPGRNVYRYNCSFRLNNQDFSSDSGGEIEIITN